MKVGTKSILFGVHCFFIHPVFVAIAWIKLYGFPFDPRYWIAFFVHDLGYIGKPNMDGIEGETHVELGARIMGVFGKEWEDFAKYHSRFYAKNDGAQYSKLCVADKYAFCVEPYFLYMPRAILSGEIYEYMGHPRNKAFVGSFRSWHKGVSEYMYAWVQEYKEPKVDTWTPKTEKVLLTFPKVETI